MILIILQEKTVTNSSGDIYLIADSDGAGLLRIGYLTLDAGSDDLILKRFYV